MFEFVDPYVSLFNKKLSSSTFFGVILLFKHLLSSLVYVLLPLYFHDQCEWVACLLSYGLLK